MAEASLDLRGIVHVYPGGHRVLDQLDLSVTAGRISVVMGANGSGKSTLLRIAAGLVRPQAGRASLADGLPVHLALGQGRLGYVPQQLGLVRSASVLDNVLLGGLRRSGHLSLLGHHAADVRARALSALELMGLRDRAEQPVRTLSGGERQRVAIARTLVQDPEIVIADELISSLDAVHAQTVIECCRHLRERGVAMLLALHHVDAALAVADDLHVLARGRLTSLGPPGELSHELAAAALLEASRAQASIAGPSVAAPSRPATDEGDESPPGTWGPVVP